MCRGCTVMVMRSPRPGRYGGGAFWPSGGVWAATNTVVASIAPATRASARKGVVMGRLLPPIVSQASKSRIARHRIFSVQAARVADRCALRNFDRGPDGPAAKIATSLMESAIDRDRKSTRLNSSHQIISYALFCLKTKKNNHL